MTTKSSTVWITGASGGLGSSLVHAYHQAGWNVVAGYRRENRHPARPRLHPMRLDLTCQEEVATAVESLLGRGRPPDVLVNNAGITADTPLAKMGASDWDRVLQVNLNGTVRLTRAILPAMCRLGNGHIVNIASFAARNGPAGQANYAASKAALLGFTIALARELGPHNVRVNAILPGAMPTDMTRHLKPEVLHQFRQANVLGRLNDIEEVARFIFFLTTTRNISGQIFPLDSRPARWA